MVCESSTTCENSREQRGAAAAGWRRWVQCDRLAARGAMLLGGPAEVLGGLREQYDMREQRGCVEVLGGLRGLCWARSRARAGLG